MSFVFEVGQRVRRKHTKRDWAPTAAPIGFEGTVLEIVADTVYVKWDKWGTEINTYGGPQQNLPPEFWLESVEPEDEWAGELELL